VGGGSTQKGGIIRLPISTKVILRKVKGGGEKLSIRVRGTCLYSRLES